MISGNFSRKKFLCNEIWGNSSPKILQNSKNIIQSRKYVIHLSKSTDMNTAANNASVLWNEHMMNDLMHMISHHWNQKYWQPSHHWLHPRLSLWQPWVQPVMRRSSIWCLVGFSDLCLRNDSKYISILMFPPNNPAHEELMCIWHHPPKPRVHDNKPALYAC